MTMPVPVMPRGWNTPPDGQYSPTAGQLGWSIHFGVSAQFTGIVRKAQPSPVWDRMPHWCIGLFPEGGSGETGLQCGSLICSGLLKGNAQILFFEQLALGRGGGRMRVVKVAQPHAHQAK
jgi:hypothetical protein